MHRRAVPAHGAHVQTRIPRVNLLPPEPDPSEQLPPKKLARTDVAIFPRELTFKHHGRLQLEFVRSSDRQLTIRCYATME